MSTNNLPRSLDVAQTASMTKWEINKKVLGMRSVVKAAKIQTISKMARTIKNLKNRKGTEEQQKANKNKVERLEEEIRIIKMLRLDDVSKFTLGSTETFEEVATNPKTSLEKRALLRLADHKKLQNIVKKFRAKHSDWKEIAAFLMTLHTSRDYKKNKTTKKEEVEVNVKASETLVQAYLSAKLGNHSDSDNVDDDNDDNGDVIDDKNKSKKVKTKDKTGKSTVSVSLNKKSERTKGDMETKPDSSGDESDSDDGGGDVGGDCDEDDGSDSSDNGDDNKSSDDDSSDDDDNDESEDSEASDTKTLDSSHCEKSGSKNLDKITTEKSVRIESTESKTGKSNKQREGKKQTKPKTVEKIEGEMIVKKLNLDSLNEDNEIPSILLTNTSDDKPIKKKRKTKDMFFEMDSDDNDGLETDNVNNEESEMVENDDDIYNDTADDNFTGQLGFNAFTTTFVDSLNSTDMMECSDSTFRSNEDWKKIRHERRDAQIGRGRGSGFQGRGRGQQSFRGQGSFRGQQSRGCGGTDSYSGRGDRGQGRGDQKQTSNDNTGKKTETLHPSWEASKKRKQMEKKQILPYAGKKIKFDD